MSSALLLLLPCHLTQPLRHVCVSEELLDPMLHDLIALVRVCEPIVIETSSRHAL